MELEPSASRLVESLRDTGYAPQAAFADIVDNSIAADADKIEITIEKNIFGNELSINFYDNGCGMNERTLINAMKYGSPKRESPKSLGKFGMGLKTASTAICRKLTVISKVEENWFGRTWDLDVIKKENKWVLLTTPLESYAKQTEHLESLVKDKNGTIVIWEEIDRLITNSGSDYTERAIEQLVEDISNHLSAVFGKFINNNIKPSQKLESIKQLELKVNEKYLQGWDPTGSFMNTTENPDRVIGEKKIKSVYPSGVNKEVNFELNGFILPKEANMTSEELKKVRYGNDNQGFYIYRENRLIKGGGWPHRMFSQDSHYNLLRVELNFQHDLDDYFEIDIRKSKINFPLKLREELKKDLSPWRNQAQKNYRSGKSPKTPKQPAGSTHESSSVMIGRQKADEDKIPVIKYDPDSHKIVIKNKFGEIEINRAAIARGTDIYVTTSSNLKGDMLWDISVSEEGRTYVILNESHEFYQRFYKSNGINPVLVQAMDSLFWALANSENKSISDRSKKNYEEQRFVASLVLSELAKALPDVE